MSNLKETKLIKDQLNQLMLEERQLLNQRNTSPPGDAALIDMLIEGSEMSFGAILEGTKPRRLKLLKELEHLQYQNQPKPSNWITQQDIDIARAVPITQFVDEKLRGRRREKIKCIFHDDREPSCILYTDQNTFNCFVCNANGDVISWIMKKNNLKFIETIRYLIRK